MHLPPSSAATRLIGAAALACIAALSFAAGRAAAVSPASSHAATSHAATPSAGASTAPSAGPLSPAVVTATPKCATSGLVVWLNTVSNGTLGSIYYSLELTNLSGHSCTLAGYPGVSAVNLAGHQLGSAASRDNTTKAHTITVKQGVNSIAVLRIVDTGNFSTSACRPTIAAGLRVFPPNQAKSKVVPFPFLACSRTGPGYLSVRAVKLG
jgi:hypothetical protein